MNGKHLCFHGTTGLPLSLAVKDANEETTLTHFINTGLISLLNLNLITNITLIFQLVSDFITKKSSNKTFFYHLQTNIPNPKVREEFEAVVTFTNSLSVPMTECKLFVEGAGIQKHKKIFLG